MTAYWFAYETSFFIGTIGIAANDSAVTRIFWGDWVPGFDFERKETPLIQKTFQELTAYFEGQCTDFTIPLAPEGTDYQRRVWRELLKIPYGETRSYKQIAGELGGSSARAVGGANGKNPIPILIPCHRVIAADGRMHGYTGGVWIKKGLLAIEGVQGLAE